MAEGTAEETADGVKTAGTVSPSAGLSTSEGTVAGGVVKVGVCWG